MFMHVGSNSIVRERGGEAPYGRMFYRRLESEDDTMISRDNRTTIPKNLRRYNN